MPDTTELVISLMAKDAASAVLGDVDQKLGKLEKTSGLLKSAFGALTGVVATSLVGALSDAARAAADDEATVIRLQQAVENSGASWLDNAAAIQERIKAGQHLAFTDEQVRDSLSMLTAQTGSLEEAMKRQSLAFDLARGAHIPLETASKLLGKVTEENVAVFARMGIVLQKGATETEAFAAIQQKFGGQAEAYGNSTKGSIDKVRDSINEWTESIGYATGPAMGFIALLPGLQSGMQLAGLAIGGVIPKLAAMTVTVGGTTTSIGALTAATAASIAPFLLVIATGVLVVEALLQVKETVDLVRDNWDKFVYALTTGQLNDIPVFGFFFGMVQRALGLVSALQSAWNTVTSIFSGASNAPQPNYNAAGFNQYAEGTDYVPHTGLAMLHQGERVVPAAQNTGGGNQIIVNVSNNIATSEQELAERIADAVGTVLIRATLTNRNLAY